MQINYEVLNIFFFLFPGLLSSVIYNSIVIIKEKNISLRLIEAFIFSLIIYLFYSIISNCTPVLLKESIVDNDKIYSIIFDNNSIITIFIFSILLPLVIGFLVNNDIFSKILRPLKITSRTSRLSTWLDVFIDQKRYIIINFIDGRRIYGWPMYFSNNFDEGYIYLYNPSWIDKDGNYIDLGVHGIFILNKDDIESIYFLDTDK